MGASARFVPVLLLLCLASAVLASAEPVASPDQPITFPDDRCSSVTKPTIGNWSCMSEPSSGTRVAHWVHLGDLNVPGNFYMPSGWSSYYSYYDEFFLQIVGNFTVGGKFVYRGELNTRLVVEGCISINKVEVDWAAAKTPPMIYYASKGVPHTTVFLQQRYNTTANTCPSPLNEQAIQFTAIVPPSYCRHYTFRLEHDWYWYGGWYSNSVRNPDLSLRVVIADRCRTIPVFIIVLVILGFALACLSIVYCIQCNQSKSEPNDREEIGYSPLQ